MVPDSVADDLAVIYGEQPAQTPIEATPEAAPEPAAPELRPQGGAPYRVRPLDTLESIATSVYGDAIHAGAILAYNQQAGLLINDNLTINGLILLP